MSGRLCAFGRIMAWLTTWLWLLALVQTLIAIWEPIYWRATLTTWCVSGIATIFALQDGLAHGGADTEGTPHE